MATVDDVAVVDEFPGDVAAFVAALRRLPRPTTGAGSLKPLEFEKALSDLIATGKPDDEKDDGVGHRPVRPPSKYVRNRMAQRQITEAEITRAVASPETQYPPR